MKGHVTAWDSEGEKGGVPTKQLSAQGETIEDGEILYWRVSSDGWDVQTVMQMSCQPMWTPLRIASDR